MTCKTCAAPLGRRNKSGYCKLHFSAAVATRPDWLEKQRAGIKRKLAADPQFLESLRARAKIQGKRQDTREQRSERFKRDQVWKIGHPASQAREVRAKAGRKLSATRMAWCPRELLPVYRELTKLGHRAPEAKAMILEQHERDMARFRAKIAPVVAPLPEEREALPECAIAAVASILCLRESELLGDDRTALLVDARAVVSVVLRGRGLSFPQIGQRLNRDHTSIMNLVQTFDRRASKKPHLRRVVERFAA